MEWGYHIFSNGTLRFTLSVTNPFCTNFQHRSGVCLSSTLYIQRHYFRYSDDFWKKNLKLQCEPMPNVMAALPNIGGALRSTHHFGWRPILQRHAVTLPRRETRWNMYWNAPNSPTDLGEFLAFFGSCISSETRAAHFRPPPPQPFYGPFSGTTRVSRCQKRTSGLYGARED